MTVSWNPKVRRQRIVRLVVIFVVLLCIGGFIAAGLIFPTCGPSQVHGFFVCKCPPNSAMDPRLKQCTCLADGSTLGTDCESASNVRIVFSADDQKSKWVPTNAPP